MASQIEHSGVVERVERDAVYVKITSHSACGSCSARQACGLAEAQDKIVEVRTTDSGAYALGEAVMVGVSKNAGMVSVLLVYVVSLSVLVGALVVALKALGWGEGAGLAAAFVSLGCYFCLLWVFRKKIETKIKFTITKI